MSARDNAAELSRRPADVRQGSVAREVEFFREGKKVSLGNTAHGAHELLEPRWIGVELLEHRPLGMLALVLRLSRLERRRQIGPKAVEPCICHLENTANILRAISVEERRRLPAFAV